jgi:hypothetical protein
MRQQPPIGQEALFALRKQSTRQKLDEAPRKAEERQQPPVGEDVTFGRPKRSMRQPARFKDFLQGTLRSQADDDSPAGAEPRGARDAPSAAAAARAAEPDQVRRRWHVRRSDLRDAASGDWLAEEPQDALNAPAAAADPPYLAQQVAAAESHLAQSLRRQERLQRALQQAAAADQSRGVARSPPHAQVQAHRLAEEGRSEQRSALGAAAEPAGAFHQDANADEGPMDGPVQDVSIPFKSLQHPFPIVFNFKTQCHLLVTYLIVTCPVEHCMLPVPCN